MDESGGRGEPANRLHAVGGGTGNNAGRPDAEEEEAHARTSRAHPFSLCGTRASGHLSGSIIWLCPFASHLCPLFCCVNHYDRSVHDSRFPSAALCPCWKHACPVVGRYHSFFCELLMSQWSRKGTPMERKVVGAVTNEDRTPHRAHHRRIFFSCRAHVTIPCTCTGSRPHGSSELLVEVRVILKSHSIVSCPIAISWVRPTILLAFLMCWRRKKVHTAPIHGAVHGLASPLTGYEPNSLIEISCEYAPINFPSRRNSFTTDLNDVLTVAASDVTEIHDERHLTSSLSTQEREVTASSFSASVHQHAAASSSQQQPAAANVINPWQRLKCLELRETAAKW